MMNNKYIGNAKIIPLSALPKIGDIDNRYHTSNGVVYSVQAIENWENDDYIFYSVWYSERLTKENIKHFVSGVDCYCFEYAVKVTDFVKENQTNV